MLAASLLANAGRFDEALDRYERILSIVPRHAPLHASYSHALKTVGRQEDSISAYRAAIAAQPEYGEAYWSLANLKTFRFRDDELVAVQKIVDHPELDRTDQFHLCFTLAKALEDSGDYDATFEYYARGNQLKKERSGYQADDTTERIHSLIKLRSAELFESKQGFGNPSRDPSFIVGLPRSGSTLLE